MTPKQRRERFDRLLSYPVPALILTRGLEAYPECLEMADKHGRTVLRSNLHAQNFSKMGLQAEAVIYRFVVPGLQVDHQVDLLDAAQELTDRMDKLFQEQLEGGEN